MTSSLTVHETLTEMAPITVHSINAEIILVVVTVQCQ